MSISTVVWNAVVLFIRMFLFIPKNHGKLFFYFLYRIERFQLSAESNSHFLLVLFTTKGDWLKKTCDTFLTY